MANNKDKEPKENKRKFDNTLKALLDNAHPFPATCLRSFSDLTKDDAARLSATWEKVDPIRKLNLFEDLYALQQDDLMLDFSATGRLGLDDEDPAMRMAAIYLMQNCQERDFAEKMLKYALEDSDEDVQCAAIRVLSGFVLAHEYEEKTPLKGEKVIEALEKLLQSPVKTVRLNAMEALSFTDHKAITSLINEAIKSGDNESVRSALTSISHTLNNRWDETVLELIDSDNDDIKSLAIKTAGELQIKQALPFLYDCLAHYDTLDMDLVFDCIWAISEIGDEDSFEVLNALGEAARNEEELNAYIDEALDNLNMNVEAHDMFKQFADPDDDEETELIAENETFEVTADEAELELTRERCLNALEEKRASLFGDEDDDCEDEYAEEDEDGHHHHHHEIDPDHYRIIDDLEEYENNATEDAEDEEDEDRPLRA